MPQFARYIGIDYSGAETADSSCKGTDAGLPALHVQNPHPLTQPMGVFNCRQPVLAQRYNSTRVLQALSFPKRNPAPRSCSGLPSCTGRQSSGY
jgi:hypothetical protein